MKFITAAVILLFALFGLPASAGPQTAEANLAGVWKIIPGNNLLLEGNRVEFVFKEGHWEGTFTAATGIAFPLSEVSVEGNGISFSFEAVPGGGWEACWSYSAKWNNGRLEGTCRYSDRPEEIPFTAEKMDPPQRTRFRIQPSLFFSD